MDWKRDHEAVVAARAAQPQAVSEEVLDKILMRPGNQAYASSEYLVEEGGDPRHLTYEQKLERVKNRQRYLTEQVLNMRLEKLDLESHKKQLDRLNKVRSFHVAWQDDELAQRIEKAIVLVSQRLKYLNASQDRHDQDRAAKALEDRAARARYALNMEAFLQEQYSVNVIRPESFVMVEHARPVETTIPQKRPEKKIRGFPPGAQVDSNGRLWRLGTRGQILLDDDVYIEDPPTPEEKIRIADRIQQDVEQSMATERQRQAAMALYIAPHPWIGYRVTVDRYDGSQWEYWRPTQEMAKKTGRRALRKQVERAQRIFLANNPEVMTALGLRIVEPTQAEEHAREIEDWHSEFEKLSTDTPIIATIEEDDRD